MITTKKEHYDYLFKSISITNSENSVVLIGDINVGKTSYLVRLTRNVVCKQPLPTVGIEYATQNTLVANGEAIVKA